VVTSSCVPAEVQVVAVSESLAAIAVTSDSPTATAVISDSPTATPDPIQKLNILRPDLVITSMRVSPNPATQNNPVSVQITVQNRGPAPSGDFSVQWLSAKTTLGYSWVVSSLAVGAMANLSCSYTYKDWDNAYTIKAVADTGAQVVEVNEDNNSLTDTFEVKPAP
jgi:subtilase family serine protease